MPVGDNQSSLKAGLRGPTLLEDFILREKITHFDHERIPERIVHARGSAPTVFRMLQAAPQYTRASIFAEAGKQTPVFVRFSTVLGERGSTDTARDVRGFAVKFYTDEGNWDLVGNNIPVFFIQDAMKFPDLVHAAKPEPHFAMPQAGTAHDTFWDFASLMPEITAHAMWAMSDRAIPRSYRTMQGFGVHTFRLRQREGQSTFVKFHWNPAAGTHSLVWDEAVKISAPIPTFIGAICGRRSKPVCSRNTSSACRSSARKQAEGFSFDVLDSDQDRSRGAGAGHAGRPDGPEPQSGQLLRGDRAGRVLRRPRRPRRRLLERPAAGRAHSLLRGHADFAARRAELPRDSDQHARRAGAQQPARRHASAGDSSRPGQLRAEFTRRRLSRFKPGAGFLVPGTAPVGTTRCAASLRGSPTTMPRPRFLQQPDRDRARAHHQCVLASNSRGPDTGDS